MIDDSAKAALLAVSPEVLGGQAIRTKEETKTWWNPTSKE